MSKWIRVGRKEPCPICGRMTWCTRSADGVVAHCMRIASHKELRVGGWIHRLSEPLPPAQPERVRVLADVTPIARRLFSNPGAEEKRMSLSKELGVSTDALERMRVGVGWDHHGEEFSSWPSRGPDGNVIGITRRYCDGSKKSWAGTSNGVFAPIRWWGLTGPLAIVEGGSDVAALASLGYAAIGRPSNLGGASIVRSILRRHPVAHVVIGENDRKLHRIGATSQCPLDCTGCSWCWPGLFGAKRVAKALGCRILMPPHWFKDIREWIRNEKDFERQYRAFLDALCLRPASMMAGGQE